MKRFLLTGVAFAAVAAGSARAADLPAAVPAYQPPPVVVAFNWTGCYVGGQIGGQWGSWTAGVEYPGVSATRAFDGTSSFIGGAQVGCNYQPIGSAFVVGIESDVIGAKNKFSGEVFRFGAGPDHFDATGEIGTQGSVRLRLGAAWDRLLVYAAAGLTRAQVNASHAVVRDGVGATIFTLESNRNGWNIGFGFDYAFAGGWNAGLEYRYTNYGSYDYAIPAGAFPAGFFAHTASADNISTNDVRLRLNYLFGGPVRR